MSSKSPVIIIDGGMYGRICLGKVLEMLYKELYNVQ